MSRIDDHHDELTREWNGFLHTWQDTRVVWKDAVASQFAKRFVAPWEVEMPHFLFALEALEEEIQAAYRELH